MENITIHGTDQTADGGNALRLTVRDCEVLAIFAPAENTGVYQRIRRVLLDACIASFPAENDRKLDKIVKI